jgi:hypothetical protein
MIIAFLISKFSCKTLTPSGVCQERELDIYAKLYVGGLYEENPKSNFNPDFIILPIFNLQSFYFFLEITRKQ